jgi:DNA-binding MarR family transcriptional regulator
MESGLSIQDYAVLVALSEAEGGRMRAFELGRELAWEKSRLSHHITRMISRDLVRRDKCPTDQRGAFVAITAQGRKAIAAAAPGHVSAVRRYFIDQLTDKELQTLTGISTKIATALSETCEAAMDDCDSD